METPSLRVRLEFGDRSILSKPQRSDGMNKSWFLLKLQQHRTISDVCTHLLNIFKLHRSCPNGILLFMDGFVLPPCESTEILKDKELICVKKKGGATPDADNLLDELETGENGLLLLANDKETEEVQSESEEVDEEQSLDEEDEEQVCKKRKASIKLQNSKNKRPCLRVLDDVENEAETQELDNDKNAEQAKQVSATGGKKMPSRSARRKKAKRKWMQELAKISKKKPQPYSKPVVTTAENKDANGRPKGLLHWKQASKKSVHKNRVEEASNQNGDVAVVKRPGHIRFENLDEDEAAKQSDVSNEPFRWRNGRSNGNGKKKGQRWSTGKFSTCQRRNDTKRIDKKSFTMSITDMQVPIIDPNDFSKLPPCCSPKEGDVIAYRLLELSSTWIPEFSSFRVGRISYYDAREIVLIPVPEYPIVTDKTDENRPNDSLYGEDGTLEINYSALLDVCYVKEYDPEAAKDKEAVTNAVEQPPVTVTDHTDAAQNLVSNSNDNNTNNVSKDSNTEANPWDHFSKANSNTEMQLPDVNHSSMVVSGEPGSSEVPDANIAESSENRDKGKEKGSMGNPWLNSDASQENQSSLTGWTTGNKVSENHDCGEGSSWGRPWSSFTPLRGSSVNVQNRGNDWGGRGSSRGNGRPWAPRGGPHGRGRGRGRSWNA